MPQNILKTKVQLRENHLPKQTDLKLISHFISDIDYIG